MKSILFLFASLFAGVIVHGQSKFDTVYFNKKWEKSTKDSSSYYRIIDKHDVLYHVKDYFNSGALQMSGAYSSLEPETKDGKFVWYFENGKVSESCDYLKGEANGERLSYFESGELEYKGSYAMGKEEGEHIYYYKTGKVEESGSYKWGKKNGEYKTYFESGQLKRTSLYRMDELHGVRKEYYESGRLYYSGNYVFGQEDGVALYYYDEDGDKLKRKEKYVLDDLTEKYCYTRTGKDTTYFAAYEMPEFPGGEEAMKKYLSRKLVYPYDARKNGIEGRVIIKFCVSETGTLDSMEVLKGVYPSIDAISMKVVKSMPPWKPGRDEGKPVRVWYNLPVTFKLE